MADLELSLCIFYADQSGSEICSNWGWNHGSGVKSTMALAEDLSWVPSTYDGLLQGIQHPRLISEVTHTHIACIHTHTMSI